MNKKRKIISVIILLYAIVLAIVNYRELSIYTFVDDGVSWKSYPSSTNDVYHSVLEIDDVSIAVHDVQLQDASIKPYFTALYIYSNQLFYKSYRGDAIPLIIDPTTGDLSTDTIIDHNQFYTQNPKNDEDVKILYYATVTNDYYYAVGFIDSFISDLEYKDCKIEFESVVINLDGELREITMWITQFSSEEQFEEENLYIEWGV